MVTIPDFLSSLNEWKMLYPTIWKSKLTLNQVSDKTITSKQFLIKLKQINSSLKYNLMPQIFQQKNKEIGFIKITLPWFIS